MLSNSLKVIKINRNMSKLWRIVCRIKRRKILVHLLVLLHKLFINPRIWIALTPVRQFQNITWIERARSLVPSQFYYSSLLQHCNWYDVWRRENQARVCVYFDMQREKHGQAVRYPGGYQSN